MGTYTKKPHESQKHLSSGMSELLTTKRKLNPNREYLTKFSLVDRFIVAGLGCPADAG